MIVVSYNSTVPEAVLEELPWIEILNNTNIEQYCIDVFYLESFTKPCARVESKDLNEHMYLVVRSLKHNNNKLVSIFIKN
jgi:hypothetical protein